MIEKPRRLSAEELILETSMIVVVKGYGNGFSPDIRRNRLVEIKSKGLILKIL